MTGTGGLFTRWGKELGGSNEAQNLVNGTLTTRVASINAQYASTNQNVLQAADSNLSDLQTILQQAPVTYETGLNAAMQNTLLQMTLDAYPTTFDTPTLRAALVLLIAQFNVGGYATGASIQRPTISVAITPGGANVGTGVMLASLVDFDGRPLDYCLAETLTATCTDDGYTGGGATAGSEPFNQLGNLPASGIYAYNYPQGSGANQNYTTLNPGLTTGTIITDGSFENWTGDVPDDWTTVTGAGTITKGTSPLIGSFNLKVTGDGSTLTRIKQAVTVQPNTVYPVNYWAKTDGSVAAGVVRISLVNFNTEAVLNDAAGTANTVSQNVSSLTASYTNVGGSFRTPAVLPANVGVMVYLSTALTNTEVLQIDAAGMLAGTQAYAGGPWCAFFRGSTDFAIGDTFAAAVANNATIATFCLQLARFFNLPGLGLKLPSASSPSISDALIS